MSRSPCAVLSGLRASNKGMLSYKSPLDSDASPATKLEFLNQLSQPSPMSPEAIKIIEERTKRLSLTPHTPLTTPHTTPTPGHTSHVPTTPRRGYSLDFDCDGEEWNEPSAATTTKGDSPNRSLLDDMQQEFDKEIKSIDDQLLEQMNENIRYRKLMFERRLKDINEAAIHTKAMRESIRQKQLEAEEQQRRAREKREEQQIILWQKSIEEDFKLQAEEMEAKLRSGEEQKRILQRNLEKQIEGLLSQCRYLIEAASSIESQFSALLRSCTHTQFLDQSVIGRVKEGLRDLKDVQTLLTNERKSGNPNKSRVSQGQAQLTALGPLLADLKTAVEQANTQGEEETKKQQDILDEAAKKLEAERLAKAAEEEEKKKKEEAEKKKDSAATSTKDTSGLLIPKSMITTYSSLHDLLSATIASSASLTSTQDKSLKMYRFNLQKAVTGTVNSISSNSGQDLIGKIVHLKKLLSGQSVQVGTTSVNTGAHADARTYCINLLAAKIVRQGEDQVASSTQAAFPVAALAVGLWTEFKEVGHHLLAHFYSVCPVLVPMYVNRTKDMSEADYMKSLGYNISKDGVVENNDLFLNRVRGTVRLYAAIIQTPQLPISASPPPHPHGLDHGWMWLARVLNLEPHPVVTAAALGDFLEIAGHALMKKYGKHFQKLLFALWKEYVPKIEKVTPVADRGPLVRLTQFLESCINAGKITEPKGCLTRQFWNTQSQGIAFA